MKYILMELDLCHSGNTSQKLELNLFFYLGSYFNQYNISVNNEFF